MTKTNRITGQLPCATLAQRIASLSTTDLVFAAKALAAKPDTDAVVTEILEAVEARLGAGATFDAVVAEVYA